VKNKIRIIRDFFRLWIHWGDAREAWQDAKYMNDPHWQKEMEEISLKFERTLENLEERDDYDFLEQNGVFIHYSYDHYVDGTNCNFSIEFTNQRQQTCWYGDNHEYGNVNEVMNFARKLAVWYLDNPARINLINSGYHDPKYIEYVEEKSKFIKKFLKDE
jgi:hypothetical protein